MPLAIGTIDGLVYVCMLCAMRIRADSYAWGIALILPISLWLMRFLDGYMVPVYMAAYLTMSACMWLVMKRRWPWFLNVLLVFAPAFAASLLGNALAQWVVKREGMARAFSLAWNSNIYSALSMLGASLLCAPGLEHRKETSPSKK